MGIINKSYNVMERPQSKNILTVPVQVSAFLMLQSLLVNQFAGVKVYMSNGKKTNK